VRARERRPGTITGTIVDGSKSRRRRRRGSGGQPPRPTHTYIPNYLKLESQAVQTTKLIFDLK
jgi:hypothetical protein